MKDFRKFDKLYKTIMEDIYDYNYNRSNELSDQTISVDNPMPIKPIKNTPVRSTSNYGKRPLPSKGIGADINFRNCDDYIDIAYYCIINSFNFNNEFFYKLAATNDIVTKDTMQKYAGMNEFIADALMKTLSEHGLNLEKFSTMTDDDLEANDIAFSDLDILIGILEWHSYHETDKPLYKLFEEHLSQDKLDYLSSLDINLVDDVAKDAIYKLRHAAAKYDEPLYV